MMTIEQVLHAIRPKAEWVLKGINYSGLLWLDKTQTKPTEQEIKDHIAAYNYKNLRRKKYPNVGDQLDAIWKGGVALDEMKNIILAVKTKYPKP